MTVEATWKNPGRGRPKTMEVVPPEARAELAAVVRRIGVPRAARQWGVSEPSVVRALDGLPLLLVVRSWLMVVAGCEPPTYG